MIIAHLHQETCFAHHFRFTYHVRMTLCNIVICFCLFSLSLLLPPAWGCRLSESPHNVYQRQGSGVVYLQPEEENNLSLPEVSFKRLRRLPNSLINPATQGWNWIAQPPS
ncbi:putative exported protein (fragment) [Salmonella sp. NCTC 11881]